MSLRAPCAVSGFSACLCVLFTLKESKTNPSGLVCGTQAPAYLLPVQKVGFLPALVGAPLVFCQAAHLFLLGLGRTALQSVPSPQSGLPQLQDSSCWSDTPEFDSLRQEPQASLGRTPELPSAAPISVLEGRAGQGSGVLGPRWGVRSGLSGNLGARSLRKQPIRSQLQSGKGGTRGPQGCVGCGEQGEPLWQLRV